MHSIHSVIMAGGSGTRFWPASRKKLPKQLISLSGDKSLLEKTIKRIETLSDINNIHIVTGTAIADKVHKLLDSSYPGINIIAEPKGRNTAPCIGYMAFRICYFSNEDDTMLILPSDHLIENTRRFNEILKVADNAIEKHNSVVTLGIRPTFAHTGYGYIEIGEEIDNINNITIHKTTSFKEKPDKDRAVVFYESGSFMWNAGIFISKAITLKNAIKEFMPELYKGLEEIAGYFGKNNEQEKFNELFPGLPSESIDTGVLEKIHNSITIPSDFDWNDVGNWTSLKDVYPTKDYGISNIDKVITIDSKDLIIHSNNKNKLIATLGVEDLIIVETNDTILIAKKDRAQEIRDIVSKVSETGLEEYL